MRENCICKWSQEHGQNFHLKGGPPVYRERPGVPNAGMPNRLIGLGLWLGLGLVEVHVSRFRVYGYDYCYS